VPNGAAAGPHLHPAQEERFEVVDGVMGCRLGNHRGELQGMPKFADAALRAEAFANEIVFERPPRVVQRALAATVAPIARRRGRSVTGETMRAAIVPAERWPGRF
jgi:hypothetical protein